MRNEQLNQECRDAWLASTPACQPGSVAQRPAGVQSRHRTVAESIVLFLNERRSRNLARDTITKYDQMLHRVLDPVLDRLCVDITTEDVRGLVNALQGLSPDTVNGYIRSLKCWANFCIEEHIATAVEPKRLRPLRVPRRIPPHLTEEEMIRLLAAPDRRNPYGCRDHCIMSLLLDTGLRLGAALSIRLCDVRRENIIVLDKGPQIREVGISPNMQQVLANWLGVRSVYMGEAFPETSDHLFPTRQSDRMGKRQFEDQIQVYARKAGIARRVYPHLLRSTYATECVRDKMGMEHLRKSMGWSSLEMARRYVEAFDPDAQDESRRHSPIARLEVGKRGARLRRNAS